jgi:hypothetical protein
MWELVERLFAQSAFSRDVIDHFMCGDTLDSFFRSTDGVAIEVNGITSQPIGPFVDETVSEIVLSQSVGDGVKIIQLESVTEGSFCSGDARKWTKMWSLTAGLCWVLAGAPLSSVPLMAVSFR